MSIFPKRPLWKWGSSRRSSSDLLASLKQAGKQLIKACQSLKNFPFKFSNTWFASDYFDFNAGATMIENGSKKLCYPVCLGAKYYRLAHTIMIETEHDVLYAQAQKLDSIGVPARFWKQEELKKPAPLILS